MMTLEEYWEFAIYYCLASLSIALNLYVLTRLCYLYLYHTNRLTRLPFYHHLSLLGQQIAAIPFVFKHSLLLCEVTGGLYAYFSVMNIIVSVIYTEINRINLHDYTSSLSQAVLLMSTHAFIVGMPLLTFLPTIINEYYIPENPWCTWNYSNSLVWEIVLQYLWVWCMLAHNSVVNVRILTSWYWKYDAQVVYYYSWYLGLYSMITYLCWIPRSVERFSNLSSNDHTTTTINAHFISFYPMYVAGIFYSIVSWKQLTAVFQAGGGYEHSIDHPESTIAYSLVGNEAGTAAGERNSFFTGRWSDFTASGPSATDRESFLLEYHLPSNQRMIRNVVSSSTGSDPSTAVILYSDESTHAQR